MFKSLSHRAQLIVKVLIILVFAGLLAGANYVLPFKLGLDLAGGTQLDYRIDLARVAENDKAQIVEGVKEVIRKRVDNLGVSEPNIYISNIADESHVVVELAGISNIEQAKEIVGKTIQLEFKEENTEPSTEKLLQAKTRSQTAYEQLLAGVEFKTLEASEKIKYPEMFISGAEVKQEFELMSEGLKTAIGSKQAGTIIAPFDLSDGYTLDAASGQIIEQKGMAVLQIKERKTEEKEIKTEEERGAKHILLSYEKAERSSSERTKEEAKKIADEVLKKLNTGTAFDELAKQYSDDTSNKDKGGDLGFFKKGAMDKAFEDAAFSLEKGKTSEVIESAFGYHIISLYDIKLPETKKENVEQVVYNKLLYTTNPDPWAKNPAITGEHFQRADVLLSDAYQPYVSISFTSEGAKLFQELTKNNIGKKVAIFVGGNMVSAPNVEAEISGGQAQISGNFSLEEAQNLARDLNTGAIPAPIELSGQTTISATLGQTALDQSVKAGLIGTAILSIAMILYYRLPGLLAVLALSIYSLTLIALIKLALPAWLAVAVSVFIFGVINYLILKSKDSGGEKIISFFLACTILFFFTFVLTNTITLTLAGIAGVILSIGMAVDANILIFERIKEELKTHKLKDAIESGFDRAWDSIRDSNFSSLITCAILFYFGSSIIRGFALNLALGILVSMFSAITLTKTFLMLSANSKISNKLSLYANKGTAMMNLQFMKFKNVWLSVSGVLVTISIVSLLAFGLNLGIDFKGGSVMEYSFENKEVSQESVASALAEFKSVQVNKTQDQSFLIKMGHLSEADHSKVTNILNEKLGKADEIKFTTVGPTIGATMQKKALIALFVAVSMIVVYIAFAFRKIPKELSPWRFGWSAIAALTHDIVITTGLFSLLGHFYGVEVDALFITALLTVMGFSVHDTIVVFDRIRENLNFKEANESLSQVADKAMNQTLARSVNTSLSVMITVVALIVFGPDSTKMFTLALLVGIGIGTYSSIFVASPLMVIWNEKYPKKSIK